MHLRAHAGIAAAGVLFGTTFVVVKEAVADVEPVPFLAVRFVIGGLVVLPLAARRPRYGGETCAPLLLMVEPVSAAILGYALGERLGVRGAIGAAVILAGIVIAEVPLVRRRSP